MSQSPETAVLVHGLWLRGIIFLLFRRWLRSSGFAVRTFSYPSVHRGLAGNAEALARFIGDIKTPVVHLVGYSLGGLVILDMLAHSPDSRIRRVVLMGSPCRGSQAAAALLATPGLSRLVGRSLRDWQTSPASAPPATVEIGVIAGNRSLGLGRLVTRLPQPNDGVVAVAETRLSQAADSIVLPVAHSKMLVSKDCADQAAIFLKTGSFVHA